MHRPMSYRGMELMKNSSAGLLVITSLLFAGPLLAQDEPSTTTPAPNQESPMVPFGQPPSGSPDELVDMRQMSCGTYSKMPDDGKSIMTIWMDGYLSGLTGDARMNQNWLAELAAGMEQACNSNPDAGIVSTVEAMVLGGIAPEPGLPQQNAPFPQQEMPFAPGRGNRREGI